MTAPASGQRGGLGPARLPLRNNETPPGPTRRAASIKAIPRIHWLCTSRMMPTTTRITAITHSSVSLMVTPYPSACLPIRFVRCQAGNPIAGGRRPMTRGSNERNLVEREFEVGLPVDTVWTSWRRSNGYARSTRRSPNPSGRRSSPRPTELAMAPPARSSDARSAAAVSMPRHGGRRRA
jgi:hypothetical protein